MSQLLAKERLISALLVLGVFYFSFMILDRLLSIAYGFNFQPYGSGMPFGFTVWGHFFNGSMAALGLFITFKLYVYGKKRRSRFLCILAFVIVFSVGAIIPYMNDSEHLIKNGRGDTLPFYVAANDLYVFSLGLLMYRLADSNKKKATVLAAMFAVFLIVHFFIYAPMFPEFYWS